MNAHRLLARYERIADAPDAIARLRRFILDLATRGKLVPQDLTDEPASELLNRIAKEKERLVKKGEIKKEKPLLPVEEDAAFNVPPTWQWTRLGIVTSYIQRGKSPEYAASDGSLVVSQKCVQWHGLDLSVAREITLESLARYEDVRFLRDGDLLWNSTGTGTIGRVIRVVDPPDKLVCDSHVTVVRCLEVDPEYIRTWLRSDHVYALIEDRAAGSTNQVELTALMATNQVVPLPPVAEQRRIVAKVDELMALCDRLETARTQRETTRDRFTAASLARLDASDPDSYRDDVLFALDALQALTTRPDQIKQLRQTILNLAVHGKLVPQEPSDEPASELLKKIAGEKARLLDEKKLKRQKELSPIVSENVPFALCAGWQWSKANEVFLNITDGFHNTPSPVLEGYPYITAKHIRPNKIDFENCLRVDAKNHGELFAKTRVKRGDILIVNIGAGCGTPAIVDVDFQFSFKNVAIVNLPSVPIGKFVLLFLLYYRDLVFDDLIKGGAQPFLGLGMLGEMLIPLPPLAEQHRIVVKVDELMALCDRLERSLIAADETRSRLLEALLVQALEPDEERELEAAE